MKTAKSEGQSQRSNKRQFEITVHRSFRGNIRDLLCKVWMFVKNAPELQTDELS